MQCSLIPIDDAPLIEIVGRELDGNSVAYENTNAVAAHPARTILRDLVTIAQIYLVYLVIGGCSHDAVTSDEILFASYDASSSLGSSVTILPNIQKLSKRSHEI